MNKTDWNLIRAFVAAARFGSFTAAAAELGTTQPTISRQVQQLEEGLGVVLFERLGRTLALTEIGERLFAKANSAAEAITDFDLVAAGQGEALQGMVRISASDVVAAMLLPSIVKSIRRDAPQLQIEVIASNELSDIRRREADIAIRHVRPEDPDLIARLVRQARARFYASESWVKERGSVPVAADAGGLEFIGFDREGRFLEWFHQRGLNVTSDNFPLISAQSLAGWALVREGLGVGVMMEDIARSMPGIVQVLPDVPAFEFPIWLVTHRELKTNRAIRTVFDRLAVALLDAPATV